MASSATARCRTCSKPATQSCGRCKDIYYCDKACQKKGWRTHKALCASSAQLGARPSEHHRRAIMLPENGADPHFVWLNTRRTNPMAKAIELLAGVGPPISDHQAYGVPRLDDAGTAFCGPDLGFMKGPEDTRPDASLLVLGNKGDGQHLDHSIYICHRDHQQSDGSAANQCLSQLLSPFMGRLLKGPLLLFGMTKVAFPRASVDLHASDLMPALAALTMDLEAHLLQTADEKRILQALDTARLAGMGALG